VNSSYRNCDNWHEITPLTNSAGLPAAGHPEASSGQLHPTWHYRRNEDFSRGIKAGGEIWELWRRRRNGCDPWLMSMVDGTKVIQTTHIHISIARVSLMDFVELLVVLQILCG
jgi:hypothetical protein